MRATTRTLNRDDKTLQKWAHDEYARGMRNGFIVKIDFCMACGRSGCRISGHHPDYHFPYHVIWCCQKCHYKLEYGSLPLTDAMEDILLIIDVLKKSEPTYTTTHYPSQMKP